MSNPSSSRAVTADTSSASTSTSSHMPTLDGVRGIAILLVVMHNLNLLQEPQGLVAHLTTSWFDRGWIGVQLFFVLSGFLITGILLDTRKAPNYFSAFFGRRVLRIFPLYYATLFLMLLVLPVLNIWHGLPLREHPQQLWNLVFLSNWIEPFYVGEGAFPHFWSLAVEEQFYLLWPFIVYRCDASQLIKVGSAIVLASPIIRWALLSIGASDEMVYSFTISRMDALALGAMAAAALRIPQWRDQLVRNRTRLSWLGVFTLAIGAGVSHVYNETLPLAQILGYSFLAMAFALFVLVAACADIKGAAGWPAWLRGATLRRFGLYSYGMYVLHVPLRDIIGLPLLRAWGLEDHASLAVSLAFILIGTVASFLVAAASYHFFELHFLRLKRHFVPRRRDGARIAGATTATRGARP